MVNHEIVTAVVYLLGGDSEYIDTEDVAMKANEVAPGRFAWRKYKDQINIENVRTFLKDASQEKHGGYLVGSGRKGWMLTPKGVSFVTSPANTIETSDLSGHRPTNEESKLVKWAAREKGRLIGSGAYHKFTNDQKDEIEIADIEYFFRLDDYVRGDARNKKVRRITNLFSDDADLASAVEFLETLVQEK